MSRFDVEKFDSPPDPDLVCCICQCVLDGPVESPCRHVFCKVCIETWLHHNRNCPTCRHRLKKRHLKPILPIVQNMLNRLLMFCDFRNNGCREKVPLEMYDKHINECDFKMMECKYEKCFESVLRKFLKKHEEEECEHREKLCTDVCGLMIPVRIYDNHDCVEELRKYSQEQYALVDTLKKKVTELNTLTEKLNQQIETLRRRSLSFDVWMSSSDDSRSLSDFSSADNYSDYSYPDYEDRRQGMTFEEFDRQDRNFWRSLRDFGDRPRRRRTRRRYRRDPRDEHTGEIDVVNTPPRSPSPLPNPNGSDVDVVNESDADRDSTYYERYRRRRLYRSRRSFSRNNSRSSSRESNIRSSSRESYRHSSTSSRSSRTRTNRSLSSDYSHRSRRSERSSPSRSYQSSRNASPSSILSGESSLYHYRRRHSSRRFISSSRSRSRSQSRSFSPRRSRSRSCGLSAAESDGSGGSIRDTGRDSDRQSSTTSSRFSHQRNEDYKCEEERDHINGVHRENQGPSDRREQEYSSDDAQRVTRGWLPGRKSAQDQVEENHSSDRQTQSLQTSNHTGKPTKGAERSLSESGYGEGSSSSAENCLSRSPLKRKRTESVGDACDYDYSDNKRRKREPAKSSLNATGCSSSTNSSHQNRCGTSTSEHQPKSQRSNSKPSSVNSQRTFPLVARPEHSALDTEHYHSDSDHTKEPVSSPEESDVTSSSMYDSSSDYEVLIPKSANQLLSEYASDESDESWKPGSSN